MSNSITTFAANTYDIDFAPARVVLTGKTMTEKRVGVITQGSVATSLYFAEAKGKVGQAARKSISSMGANKMVREVRTGNYRSVAEALAVLLGCSMVISTRASYESLTDRLEAMLADLKDDGYKAGKPTAKRVAIESAVTLLTSINDGVQELISREQAEKAAS